MAKTPGTLDDWRAANAAEAAAVRAASDIPEKPDQPDELLLDQRIPEPGPTLSPTSDFAATLPPRKKADIAIALMFGLLGLVWVIAWLRGLGTVPADPVALTNWIAQGSGPLALLAILYILIRRTATREAQRFADTAISMRLESNRLEGALAQITAALDSRRRELTGHIAALLEQGNGAAERLAQISVDMRDETDLLARHSEILNQAAAAARGDMSALMIDLPRAKALSSETAEFITAIGGTARQTAEALSDQLTAIVARTHEADEAIGGAAGRLATQIGRIESRTERTTRAIEDASGALTRSVDTSLDQTTEAIEQTRHAMDGQRAAMDAMIEHARAAIEEAGVTAATQTAERMEHLGRQADAFAAKLAEQDQMSRMLVHSLERALTEIETRFEALGTTGAEQTADLAEMIVTLSAHVGNVGAALNTSMSGARTLGDRANGLRIAFDTIVQNVERDLPATMSRMEKEAMRGDATMRAVMAQAEQLAATVEHATERLGSADLLIDRQRDAIAGLGDQATRRMATIAADGDALLDRQRALSDGVAKEAAARLEALRDHSTELTRLIAESEDTLRSLAEYSGGRLVDALLKVRETAGEAARSARAALESVIPEASGHLANGAAEAIERAFGERITNRIALISNTAEAAVAAANHASEKLLKHMLTIADTSTAMEQRVAEIDTDRQEQDQDNFARQVSLLVEALNSAAIDVSKILSNDVTDQAWTAYLRGDRGAFTRRAVQLLDAGEVHHVGSHYDRDPEFREHVNKYIRDFETMLRRILASRDGGPLGVTMLSSDMGKLYVALAQAIERLRV